MAEKKILIVDDDKDLLEGLLFLFRSEGYDVVSASDAFSAVNIAQTEKPDIIILDLSLPGRSGYYVMEQLQSSMLLPSVPIIVLTAGNATFNRERALNKGAEDFFLKPFDTSQLTAAVKKALGGKTTKTSLKESSGRKILIVDDDQDLLEGLNLLFSSRGYDVSFAMDALSVAGVALKTKPDIILLDLSLPGGDGYQVMKRLRSLMPLAHTPIIVLTARDASTNQKRALTEGAKEFFQKPFDNSQLIDAVEKTLRESGGCRTMGS